ncbi:hypothetical protein VPH35_125104 [Triticum aestivum]
MAGPTQSSPLRRWKRFFRAFDSVDAAIKPSDPDHSRDELRRARVDIVEQLCDAADDDQAERLCGMLDDHMVESVETLRLVPVMPSVLASTDLCKSVCALRRHESKRVHVLARGLVSGWRASLKDELGMVRDAMHKLDNINMPETKEIAASPAGDRAGLCSEEKMETAKRKFHQAYQEAEDAKRRRRTQLVQAPKMMQPIRRCTSSMVKKTFAIKTQLHVA